MIDGAGDLEGHTQTVRRPLVDPFGRAVTYLRVSVTDRCDFRCFYCMDQDPAFLPREDLLSLEELDRICGLFVQRGVRKLRLTGGEPLVRREILTLIRSLGRHLDDGGLNELTLTTNGGRLARFAEDLAAAGMKRINVSLDTLDGERFRAITRQDALERVLDGIFAARAAGLTIKINKVVTSADSAADLDEMLSWCGIQGFDLTLIEAMPMGENRNLSELGDFIPMARVKKDLMQRWTLTTLPDNTGGPARYARVEETGQRLGFITPMSSHFCEGCNRVRLTCTGTLYLCLGQDDCVDLRAPLRRGADDEALHDALDAAIAQKPQGHEFTAQQRVTPERRMNVTGG